MSLRSRRKKSSVGIICCFTGGTTQHHRRASFDAASYSASRSPGCFKSEKCRSFISRIGRHRRHASAEFTYDPLSYSLNFNHDDVDDDDSHAMTSFSARFSAMSSPRRTPHALDHHSPTYASPDRWKVEPRIRNKSGLSSTTGEEPAPAVGISSNREILVQLC